MSEVGVTPELSTNEVLRVIQDERRRAVIRRLTEERSASIGDLAVKIAAEGVGVSAKAADASLRERHLPKLEDARVIRREETRVSAGPNFRQARLATNAVLLVLGPSGDLADIDPIQTDRNNDRLRVRGVPIGVLDSGGDEMAFDHYCEEDGYVAFETVGQDGLIKPDGAGVTLFFEDGESG